jgi:ankyrin repeat protein
MAQLIRKTSISILIVLLFLTIGNCCIQYSSSPALAEIIESKQDAKLKETISVDNLEEAVKLIREGAGVNTTDERGRTALMIAASGGEMDKEHLKFLLSKDADVNIKDQDGSTALNLAVVFGSRETVSLLLSKGAKANIKDNTGKTPLMLAEESGKEDIAELLRSK